MPQTVTHPGRPVNVVRSPKGLGRHFKSRKVILIRRGMPEPRHNGPANGQYALQHLLKEHCRREGIDWIKFDGSKPVGFTSLHPDHHIPWFWSWLDINEINKWCLVQRRPAILGPNIFFRASANARSGPHEADLCDSYDVPLVFTESRWYEELIRRNLGKHSRAQVVVWPYPIFPLPAPPKEPRYDLLLYCKSAPPQLANGLAARFKSHVRIQYGRYERERLIHAARLCRACAYLSADDRGPLALAEILLAGCPAVGIAKAAPWVDPVEWPWPGDNPMGQLVKGFEVREWIEAIERLHAEAVPEMVRLAALEKFDADRICRTIVAALQAVRESV